MLGYPPLRWVGLAAQVSYGPLIALFVTRFPRTSHALHWGFPDEREAVMPRVVLIVEDQALVAMVTQLNLEQAGYHVCGIASTEEGAIDLGSRHQPDLAVVDISLAPGDGAKVARFLKAEIGTGVFLLSAEPDLHEIADGVGVLCASKPFDAALLPRAFEYVLQHRAGERIDNPPAWLHGCQL